MKFNKSDATINRSIDDSDPGFTLKGHKLRWISAGVETRRAGRIWQALKVSMLPENVTKHLSTVNPRWIEGGDDTIRRRDLTLSFAPLKLVEERRAENKNAQKANEAVFGGKHRLRGGATSEGSSANERVSPSQEFRT